jgi:hypothetical protein
VGKLDDSGAGLEMTFEAHGVHAQISASDAELFDALTALLPPEATLLGPGTAAERFALFRKDDGYGIVSPWEGDQACRDRELALALLESELLYHVASHAPDRTFVHAGVAAHRGRAIVIPGASLSGKTTLVTALVRAGAIYYSDECALLDERGFVFPFAKPLSIRAGGAENDTLPVERLGGVKGTEPVRIGILAVTSYKPGAQWRPQRRSRGQGVLAIVENTHSALERPADTLAIARRALDRAIVLEGDRGEADVAAAALMEFAEQLTDLPAHDGI